MSWAGSLFLGRFCGALASVTVTAAVQMRLPFSAVQLWCMVHVG